MTASLIFCFLSVIFCFDRYVSASLTEQRYRGRYTRSAVDYDLVIPRRVNEYSEFISHQIPHHYKRSFYRSNRNIDREADKIHYVVAIDGEDHHIELWPNTEFISPGMVIEKRTKRAKDVDDKGGGVTSDDFDDLSPSVNMRKADDTQCHFQGRVRGDQTSRVALSTCYGLAGHIRTKRGYYIIEPAEGHDPLEGSEHPHLVYNLNANDDHLSECGVKENLASVLTRRTLSKNRLRPDKIKIINHNTVNGKMKSKSISKKGTKRKRKHNHLHKNKKEIRNNDNQKLYKKPLYQKSPDPRSANSHRSSIFLSYPNNPQYINPDLYIQNAPQEQLNAPPLNTGEPIEQDDQSQYGNINLDELELHPYQNPVTSNYQLMNDIVNPDTMTYFQINANHGGTNSEPSYPIESFPNLDDSEELMKSKNKQFKLLRPRERMQSDQKNTNLLRLRRELMNQVPSKLNSPQEINSHQFNSVLKDFDTGQMNQQKRHFQQKYFQNRNLGQPQSNLQQPFFKNINSRQSEMQQNNLAQYDMQQNNLQLPILQPSSLDQSGLQQPDIQQNILEQDMQKSTIQQQDNYLQQPNIQQNNFQTFSPLQTNIQQPYQQENIFQQPDIDKPYIFQSDLPQSNTLQSNIQQSYNQQPEQPLQSNSFHSDFHQSYLQQPSLSQSNIRTSDFQKNEIREANQQSTEQTMSPQSTSVPLSNESTTTPHAVMGDKGCEGKKNKTLPTTTKAPESKYVFYKEGSILNIETLVVVDKTMLDYHIEFSVEEYVFTIFNMAYDLFQDDTFGIPTNLVIVRLIKLIHEDDELNLCVTKNATSTLENFITWQYNINDANDSHPNHHDVAVLLTRTDICADNDTCGLFGMAKLGSICEPKMQGAICQDNGLKIGYVIAHEIGHTLGIPHDTEKESGCAEIFLDDSSPVMSPKMTMKTYKWSSCSHKYFNMFLQSGFGDCLLDEPTDHNFDQFDMLSGVMYGYEYQCKHLFTQNAKPCDKEIVCDSLNCYLEPYGCIETNIPPAPGTACGAKKWCYRGDCVPVGMRYGVNKTDGGWGRWSSWSKCSRTCGMGVAWSERECDHPRPAFGGEMCKGPHKRHKVCNLNPCNATALPFRDVQCASYDHWLFPEDKKIHKWKAVYLPYENPCTLFCENEIGAVISPKPEVIDGTQCFSSPRDICIGGLCKEVPCDYDLESNTVEDACGICKGDGTECDYEDGLRYSNPHSNCSFLDIPKGARNIRVEVMKPSKTRVLVKDRSALRVFNDGENFGIFDVPGSKALLAMIRRFQTTLDIPGPVSEDLSVWLQVCENDVPVWFTMAVKAKKKRKASFEWDFIDWTQCNAACGPGTSESLPKCVEREAGHVDDSYCKHFEKPKPKIKSCEIIPCAPRWLVGDWRECIDGNRLRSVKCVLPDGHSESEIDILPDESCKITKPIESESCADKINTTCSNSTSTTNTNNSTCGCNATTVSSVKTRSVNRQDDDSDIEYEKVLKKLQKHERAKNFELKFLSSKIRARKRSHNFYPLHKRNAKKHCPKSHYNLTRGMLTKDFEYIDDLKVTLHKNNTPTSNCATENDLPIDNTTVIYGKKALEFLESIEKTRNSTNTEKDFTYRNFK